jgi:serine/threonine-protein kinase
VTKLHALPRLGRADTLLRLMELSAGATIAGRYSLHRQVGEGGMGSVWKAEDDDGGVVALKFVHEARASSAKLRRRLIREAKGACTVIHPCVVQVHDILELEDGAPVMVMEFLDGESLAQRLDRDGDIPLKELAPLMQQVVSAVGAAHALGVIHRDLKPENIFLAKSADGTITPKILDFGIAKLTSPEPSQNSTELTKTGTMMGTPCYMAPEQVYGERDVDARADVWALGLIIYRALSGLLPTKADNVGQVMKIITVRGIWPLSQAVADVPDDVAELVDRMLRRERDERVASMHEVRETLSRYTDIETPDFGPPVSSSSAEPVPDSAFEPLAVRSMPASSPAAEPKKSPGRLVIAAVAAAAIGVAAWNLSSTPESVESAPPVEASAAATAEPSAEPVEVATSAPAEPAVEAPAAPSAMPPPKPPTIVAGPMPKPKPAVAPEPAAEPKPPPAPPKPAGPGEHGKVVVDPPF